VTFLFTDMEGSTRLLHELGAQEYGRALAEHRWLVREAFARHGGVEVDMQGDAFFYAFPTAPGALQAAAEAREALRASGPIRVRMGLHTGTPLLGEEGYVGHDVHRAARIAAAGHGGQVLVSASTAALVDADQLHDLAEHRLKDLSAPERIYQLGADGFPPLKTLYRANLPVPSTPFLGRERELEDLTALLSREDVRLVTLTGPGGTGKTRLALQAAALQAERLPDGVWWVPLTSVRDPRLVLQEVAQTLESQDGLAEQIADKRMLLLFDNFEHVVEAAPGLAELLEPCPNLELLITSREPLRLAGEREYAVPLLAENDAVALFLERSVSVEAGEPVRVICRVATNAHASASGRSSARARRPRGGRAPGAGVAATIARDRRPDLGCLRAGAPRPARSRGGGAGTSGPALGRRRGRGGDGIAGGLVRPAREVRSSGPRARGPGVRSRPRPRSAADARRGL
jgi:AAA ATPase domain/Adenylate and Guanylate cyclase catalytic domain